MQSLVWITRAEPDASATARRVSALARQPLVAPLLDLQPLTPAVKPDGVAALAFTSANAVRAFAVLTADRGAPAYAVGRRTAEAAAEAGFRLVAVGAGGVDDLARLIIDGHDAADGGVLHPSAREPAGDLTGALRRAGVKAERLAVYAAEPVPALPQAAADPLAAGEIEAVLVHSPRAAQALAQLTHDGPLRRALAKVRALGLSPACLAPLAALPLAARTAPDHPSEAALLSLL